MVYQRINLGSQNSNFENLLDDKQNKLLVEVQSKNITGNGQRYKEQTYNIAKTGYTPLGVLGWNTGNIDWYLNCIYKSGSLYAMAMRNDNATWSATLSFNVAILYQKNS